ncbi:autotransporter outer membrane beta-barrel domain-containing protein [Paludibacterium yongneupense]|uniref:autotransporter family protein n=1 Tax=Paludibacterium yongneupense TaxID=400061 RepID=UPI00041DFB49|nr:autotransporter outer membrane beta-barrel domain-containing protein [Paludibacterium yongneupense]
MKMKIKPLLLLILGSMAVEYAQASGDVLVYDGSYSDVAATLAARQTAAGNTPTVISWVGGSVAALPANLSTYKQIWDVNGNTALTAAQQTAYLSYLQGGGALFLMGENTGYGAARNATLITFIQAAGGGTVAITSNAGSAETVDSALQSPHAMSTFSYAASGSYTTPGTGICLTKNSSNTCSAIAFNVGTLANARYGSLVSVLDINFLESSRAGTSQDFVDNLIAYLAAQAAAGQAAISGGSGGSGNSGFIPHSNSVSQGAAGVLDQLTVATTIDVDMATAIGQLSAMSASGQSAALEHIAPQTNRAVTVASSQTVNGALDTVASRLDSLRSTGLSAGLSDDLDSGKIKVAGGDLTALFDGSSARRNSAWLKAFGAKSVQDMAQTYSGYHATTGGIALGVDTLLRNHWVVGTALTYASTRVSMNDYRTGDATGITSYQLTGYASRDFGKWYVDTMLAYARHDYNSTRDTTITGTATGNYRGEEYAARVNAGYPFAIGGERTLTPFIGIEANHSRQDGYTETGAGPLSMTVQGSSADRLRSVLGAKLATSLDILNGINVKPSLTLAYRHEFRNNGVDSTSTFTGGGASFTTPGQSLARDTYAIGLASTFSKSRNVNVKLQIDQELAAGYHSLAGQVMGQWLF